MIKRFLLSAKIKELSEKFLARLREFLSNFYFFEDFTSGWVNNIAIVSLKNKFEIWENIFSDIYFILEKFYEQIRYIFLFQNLFLKDPC